jgi:superfamily II DNA or RNA helicase
MVANVKWHPLPQELQEVAIGKYTCGHNPDRTGVDPDGSFQAKAVQREAFKKLRHALLGMLTCPTGSGKSWTLLGLAWDAVESDSQARSIIIAPQCQIVAGSFDYEKKKFHDVRFGDKPGKDVFSFRACRVARGSENNALDEVRNFLTASPSKLPERRMLVCTHTSLVQVFRELQLSHPKVWRKFWRKVHLFCDEAHHGKYMVFDKVQNESDYKDQIAQARNGLGEVFNFYIEYGLKKSSDRPGRLLLVSATFMRSDAYEIVDRKWLEGPEAIFTEYEQTIPEYLDSMEHLKEISLGFIVGSPEKAIQHIYGQSTRNTVIYTPQTQSPLCDGYYLRGAPDESGLPIPEARKYRMLGRYEPAVGELVRRDGHVKVLRCSNGKQVRLLDLVTPKGRIPRTAWMRKVLNDKDLWTRGLNPFSLILAMGLCQEGFDWPWLERVLVIGHRWALNVRLQILGRLLRDTPGKKSAEFLVNLPAPDDIDDPEKVEQWVRDSLNALVEILAVGIHLEPRDRTLRETDAERLARHNAMDILREIARGDNGEVSDKGLTDAAVARVLTTATDDQKEAVSHIFLSLLGKRSQEMRETRGLTDSDIKGQELDCIRIWTLTITGKSLKDNNLQWSRARLPFDTLKAEVRRLKIRSQLEYGRRYREIHEAPEHPAEAYKKEWRACGGTWGHFLGLTHIPGRKA